jgi:ribosomal protein L37AE/L43A
MIKTGEFKVKKSCCDFCITPAVRVTEEGIALCETCDKEQQLAKQASALNWERKKDAP